MPFSVYCPCGSPILHMLYILPCSKSLWGTLQFLVIIFLYLYFMIYLASLLILYSAGSNILLSLSSVFLSFIDIFEKLLLYFPIVLYTWVFFNSLKAFKITDLEYLSNKWEIWTSWWTVSTDFIRSLCICTFSHFSAWLTFFCYWKLDILNKIMRSSGK